MIGGILLKGENWLLENILVDLRPHSRSSLLLYRAHFSRKWIHVADIFCLNNSSVERNVEILFASWEVQCCIWAYSLVGHDTQRPPVPSIRCWALRQESSLPLPHGRGRGQAIAQSDAYTYLVYVVYTHALVCIMVA